MDVSHAVRRVRPRYRNMWWVWPISDSEAESEAENQFQFWPHLLPNLDHVEQKARGSVETFDDTNNLVGIVGHLWYL